MEDSLVFGDGSRPGVNLDDPSLGWLFRWLINDPSLVISGFSLTSASQPRKRITIGD